MVYTVIIEKQMTNKSKINEYCQQNDYTNPKYTIISREGPPHNPVFIVECRVIKLGQGLYEDWIFFTSGEYPTRKEAENNAALKLFQYLNENEDESDKEMEDESEKKQSLVTVFIDGDNVHEALEWISTNREEWNVHLFITQNTVVRDKVRVHRSISNGRDATDVAMIIYVTRYLPLMEKDETLILVSRDKIFRTLGEEINDCRICTAQTLSELSIF